jgi:hypothetical protein
MKVPLIPVLLNVLSNIIPTALNPMVYALKNKELWHGLYKVLRLDIKGNYMEKCPCLYSPCIYLLHSSMIVNSEE